MRRTAIDLFAGAGGLSLGFELAGFSVLAAVESDRHAVQTYRRNHPDVEMIEGDIRAIDPAICLGKEKFNGALDVLVGGPPCKGFSESNRRTRTLSNPRNYLYREFFRFLAALKPMWFVLENVVGVRTLAGGVILRAIIEEAMRLGYSANWRELSASSFGVPQYRRRIFVVGNRVGASFQFPFGDEVAGVCSVRDAISDLPVLVNGASIDHLEYGLSVERASDYQKLMRNKKLQGELIQGNIVTRNSEIIVERYRCIGQGENWQAIPSGLMGNYKDVSRCHTGIYHRLRWDEPSRVIGNFRKNMLIHPDQDRGLSIREAARLQSFPDHYEFTGSIGFQQQQVADAVPPLLAKAVAMAVNEAGVWSDG